MFLVECANDGCAERARVQDFFRQHLPEGIRDVPYGSELANALLDQASEKFNGAVHPVWGIMDDKGAVHLLRVQTKSNIFRDAHQKLRKLQATEEQEGVTA